MNSYKLSRAWAEIHLDRFRNNLSAIKHYVGENTKVMAVIKADAYGCGVKEISKAAVENGADYLAVACVDEAKQLRRNGITVPILILGATPLECVEDLFQYEIIPTVFEQKLPQAISHYAKEHGKRLKIHIKVDTGMGRLGFPYYDDSYVDSVTEILKISELQGIEVEGIFTHFSNADCDDTEQVTKKQLDCFMEMIRRLNEQGLQIPIRHAANSAAICLYPEMHLDMVRPGIILYGEYPSCYVEERTSLKLQSVMELKARVWQVKTVRPGQGISYGKTYITDSEKVLASVGIGYADGYFRKLSNRIPVIINGKLARQVGNICMDQTMVDVTDIPDVSYGTEVILIGTCGENRITFSEMAECLGSINYEMMCDIGKRIVKAYFDGDTLVKTVNYVDKI